MENYAPFLTGWRVSNLGNKKDFSLSFETSDVILPNIADEGYWKSSLNLLYNVHDVTEYPKARITIYELYFITTILGAIVKNCWLEIFFLWSKAIEFKIWVIFSSFDQVSIVWRYPLGPRIRHLLRNHLFTASYQLVVPIGASHISS